MINILFFGNCQTKALKDTLNLNTDKYKLQNISCYKCSINKEDFTKLIRDANIIITQPLCDNYRNLDYLNTKYIVNTASLSTNIIIFNSCYFDFYYPDMKYKKHNNTRISFPCDYHYQFIVDCYMSNITVSEYIDEFVNNKNLISKATLLNRAENSIYKLRKRDIDIINNYSQVNVKFISIADYIEDNYRDKLLFHSVNHPTKIIFQFLSHEIIKCLNLDNTINYDADTLSEPTCILYKCIENVVNFEVNNDNILMKLKDIESPDGCVIKIVDLDSLVNMYYDTYNSIDFRDE